MNNEYTIKKIAIAGTNREYYELYEHLKSKKKDLIRCMIECLKKDEAELICRALNAYYPDISLTMNFECGCTHDVYGDAKGGNARFCKDHVPELLCQREGLGVKPISQGHKNGWKDIKTAPRGESLLRFENGVIVVGEWIQNHWEIGWNGMKYKDENFTHWREIPEFEDK